MKRVLLGSFLIAAASLSSSCASTPDNKQVVNVALPDYDIYAKYVDAYIQRRCGTLDCHGQPGRAYRIYGFAGFRLYNEDAGLVSGEQPTTPAEVRANFQAAVSLEPEEMSLAIQQGGDPAALNRLLLLRKPLNGPERHKGGPAMAQDDPGYRCVVGWLRIRTVRALQTGGYEPIPQAEREPFSASATRNCEEAASFP